MFIHQINHVYYFMAIVRCPNPHLKSPRLRDGFSILCSDVCLFYFTFFFVVQDIQRYQEINACLKDKLNTEVSHFFYVYFHHNDVNYVVYSISYFWNLGPVSI